MIKPQHFVVLAATTLVALVLAAFLHASWTQRAPGIVEGRPALPELRTQANALGAIELSKRGRTLTLVRKGEAWSIKERAGYPVEADKVRALLVQLTNAELAEAKTAAKDRWPLLDLEDPAATDAKSALVRLLDGGGKPIASLVIGKRRNNAFGTGRHGVYVRRPDATQTWLVNGDPSVTLDVKDWVDAAIYKADPEKLVRVTIAHPREVPIVVEREGGEKGGKFMLKSVPEGMKVKESAGVEQIALSLGSVELEDMRKLEATPAGDAVSVITAENSDGMTVTLRLRREGDAEESWLSFTATGESAEAKKAADAINARGAGWEFKIPKWKADQIGKRAADIFETS